jgi:hypothetical protein
MGPAWANGQAAASTAEAPLEASSKECESVCARALTSGAARRNWKSLPLSLPTVRREGSAGLVLSALALTASPRVPADVAERAGCTLSDEAAARFTGPYEP